MIAHTTSQRLIAQYGNTPAGRHTARRVLRAEIVAKAEREAELAGRSLNCEGRKRAYGAEHEPCLNDGTSCICECHDQQVKVKP